MKVGVCDLVFGLSVKKLSKLFCLVFDPSVKKLSNFGLRRPGKKTQPPKKPKFETWLEGDPKLKQTDLPRQRNATHREKKTQFKQKT